VIQNCSFYHPENSFSLTAIYLLPRRRYLFCFLNDTTCTILVFWHGSFVQIHRSKISCHTFCEILPLEIGIFFLLRINFFKFRFRRFYRLQLLPSPTFFSSRRVGDHSFKYSDSSQLFFLYYYLDQIDIFDGFV
jgi:hypothetical protein